MEVLKKMMHHHTLTPFRVPPESVGERGGARTGERGRVCHHKVVARGPHGTTVVHACVCVKVLTVRSSSQAGGRHYSLQPSVREPISI